MFYYNLRMKSYAKKEKEKKSTSPHDRWQWFPSSFKTRRISPTIYGFRVMSGFDTTSGTPESSEARPPMMRAGGRGGTPIDQWQILGCKCSTIMRPKSRICRMITYQSIALTFETSCRIQEKTVCLLLRAKSLLRPLRTIKNSLQSHMITFYVYHEITLLSSRCHVGGPRE